MNRIAVRTAATLRLRHLLTAELAVDAAAPTGPQVDTWHDFAWNLRIGRAVLTVTIDPLGNAVRANAVDAARWVKGTLRYLTWRYAPTMAAI